ncbi:hypothetical protein M0802_004198 [Mischocyttarus mexicanus]|nr:hypothetical protein M0802_004198 [Mischocyttarus mexicanus]
MIYLTNTKWWSRGKNWKSSFVLRAARGGAMGADDYGTRCNEGEQRFRCGRRWAAAAAAAGSGDGSGSGSYMSS